MRLGIMQPYFLPYLGYFDLINRCDKWIVFDTPQYIRHGWVNRNRVLHPQQGWQYILVPLEKHARETAITDIKISESTAWRTKITGQLNHYRKKAPYFKETIELLNRALQVKTEHLSNLNVHLLREICAYLDIDFNYELFSEMKLPLGRIEDSGDWALKISAYLNADAYINPPGGMDLFEEELFNARGIALEFQKYIPFSYKVRGYQFEPDLSIIDVLMWTTPYQIKKYLDKLSESNPLVNHPVSERYSA